MPSTMPSPSEDTWTEPSFSRQPWLEEGAGACPGEKQGGSSCRPLRGSLDQAHGHDGDAYPHLPSDWRCHPEQTRLLRSAEDRGSRETRPSSHPDPGLRTRTYRCRSQTRRLMHSGQQQHQRSVPLAATRRSPLRTEALLQLSEDPAKVFAALQTTMCGRRTRAYSLDGHDPAWSPW